MFPIILHHLRLQALFITLDHKVYLRNTGPTMTYSMETIGHALQIHQIRAPEIAAKPHSPQQDNETSHHYPVYAMLARSTMGLSPLRELSTLGIWSLVTTKTALRTQPILSRAYQVRALENATIALHFNSRMMTIEISLRVLEVAIQTRQAQALEITSRILEEFLHQERVSLYDVQHAIRPTCVAASSSESHESHAHLKFGSGSEQ